MPKMVVGGYAILLLTVLGTVDEVFATLEFVTVMSFHAQVSDPILGGVYMTVLNSAANFGGMWPESLILWITGKLGANPIDIKHPFNRTLILNGTQNIGILFTLKTVKLLLMLTLFVNNRKADFMPWDPYYPLSLFTIIIGVFWLIFFRSRINRLEKLPKACWRIKPDSPSIKYTKLSDELSEDDVIL